MEPALLGLILDSSVLIAAERRNLRPDQAIESVQRKVGEIPIVLSAVTAVTEVTAEIVARIGGDQAAKGVNLPLADLLIGACALELGYAVGTSTSGTLAALRVARSAALNHPDVLPMQAHLQPHNSVTALRQSLKKRAAIAVPLSV